MSRVPAKIKVGDTVFYADTNADGTATFIFGGVVARFVDVKLAKISPWWIHEVQSDVGISPAVMLMMCTADSAIVPLSSLRSVKEAKYLK